MVSRRRFLASGAAVGVASFGGCMQTLSGVFISDAGKRPLAENPVARDLDAQPRLGPPHEQTSITVVIFDDPSCGSCQSFHEDGFQDLRSEWTEHGKASVYARAAARVQPWGKPATHALEAAYRRDPAAYWTLKDRYFGNQDAMTLDNLATRTEAFLADTDVDGGAVANAATERSHEEAIAADEKAVEDAGDIFGLPSIWLFKDGEFVTGLGEADFEQFENAVESHA